jgi:peptide methionine sulfoxide reductase msrA/msrB
MKGAIIALIVILVFVVGCTNVVEEDEMIDKTNNLGDKGDNLLKATFAGGCFWCMEAAFEGLDGIIDVVSGYSGGEKINPTYEEVLTGTTGHKEAIQITYDPQKINYGEILKIFWRQIDPTDAGGQFTDRGPQYQTAIFYHNDNQKELAEKSKEELANSGKFEQPIVTEILSFTQFYLAEEYHQDYSKKRTIQYKAYEKGSGRLDYKKEMWEE